MGLSTYPVYTGAAGRPFFIFMAKPNKPLFYLQIVDEGGVVANLPGGGPLEASLIDLIANTIMAKGVGFFRTSTHVEKDVRDGVKEAIMSLKHKTVQLV